LNIIFIFCCPYTLPIENPIITARTIISTMFTVFKLQNTLFPFVKLPVRLFIGVVNLPNIFPEFHFFL
jgi:hypothetical protein